MRRKRVRGGGVVTNERWRGEEVRERGGKKGQSDY